MRETLAWRRRGLALAVFAAIQSFVAASLADPVGPAAAVTDSARAAARRLGYEGVEAYQRGDYEVALDKLARAYAIAKVPSLGLWLARAMVKRGRWVEAAERYIDVVGRPLEEGDPAIQKQAKEDAARERAALLPRIPQLTIVVRGPDLRDVTLKLDGVPIAPNLLGVAFGVDPGEHDIELRGANVVRRHLRLAEGDARTEEFDLTAASRPSAPTPQSQPGASSKGGARRTLLVASASLAGAGVVGVGLGSVLGLLASSRVSAAKAACPNPPACPSDAARTDSEHARTLADVSTVAFFVGGGALIGSAVLWSQAPSKPKTIGLSIEPGFVAVRGSF